MASKPNMKPTERDSALLQDICTHKYLSMTQVQRLHFVSEQTAYRRIRALRDAGLVRTFQVPGHDEQLVALDKTGALHVAESLGVDATTLRWNEKSDLPKDHYFVRHFLAVNDFWIMLRQACTEAPVGLLGFIPDSHGERTKSGAVTKYIRDTVGVQAGGTFALAHTPDAVFALGRGERAALFFLEVDRGTEVVSDPDKGVLKSIRFYVQYLLSGGYQRYAKDFDIAAFKGFRALYVTTGDMRATNMRQAANTVEAPDKAKRFLWLTTFDELIEPGILAPVWRSLDSRDDTQYSIVGPGCTHGQAENSS
jgi:hypothetical protein